MINGIIFLSFWKNFNNKQQKECNTSFCKGNLNKKKKENAAPLNAPRNGCSSKLSDRNDFPGKNARERRDLAKHRRILIIRVREKRGGEKKEKRK